MIRMHLSELAQRLAGQQHGPDVEFHGVSTDTRSLQANNLFVALSGPNFDAHDFVEAARAQGAAAALLARPASSELPQLTVSDTRLALGQLARLWRERFSVPVIGITGSNGKTTVKEMLASILRQKGAVRVTQGNLNNDIGLPLTLLRLSAQDAFAVIEMGANHPGEIAYLTNIAQPDIALVTNAGPAHLEGFGSLDGVARAKGELFAGLSPTGIAIINADDVYAPLWHELAGTRRMTSFGLDSAADVSARWQICPAGSAINLCTPRGEIELNLGLPGRHNVMNALAATAAALAADASLADVKAGLEAMRPVHGRLEIGLGAHGASIIDDTYNANPASLQAAFDVLASCPAERWLALGDMGELGDDSAALHEAAGTAAREAGVTQLFATGAASRLTAQVFGAGARHFSTQDELIVAVRSALGSAARVTLLVKGSRAARMERVVSALSQPVRD